MQKSSGEDFFFNLFIYLLTITLLIKKKIQYITYTTCDPILQFLHGAGEKEKKTEIKATYKGLSKTKIIQKLV